MQLTISMFVVLLVSCVKLGSAFNCTEGVNVGSRINESSVNKCPSNITDPMCVSVEGVIEEEKVFLVEFSADRCESEATCFTRTCEEINSLIIGETQNNPNSPPGIQMNIKSCKIKCCRGTNCNAGKFNETVQAIPTPASTSYSTMQSIIEPLPPPLNSTTETKSPITPTTTRSGSTTYFATETSAINNQTTTGTITTTDQLTSTASTLKHVTDTTAQPHLTTTAEVLTTSAGIANSVNLFAIFVTLLTANIFYG